MSEVIEYYPNDMRFLTREERKAVIARFNKETKRIAEPPEATMKGCIAISERAAGDNTN